MSSTRRSQSSRVILLHSKGKLLLQNRRGEMARTLEGQIVSVCDAIAYISHDIDDALRAQIASATLAESSELRGKRPATPFERAARL